MKKVYDFQGITMPENVKKTYNTLLHKANMFAERMARAETKWEKNHLMFISMVINSPKAITSKRFSLIPKASQLLSCSRKLGQGIYKVASFFVVDALCGGMELQLVAFSPDDIQIFNPDR